MASSPSAAFLRLRAFIAERMRMSPIDQPLMLMELLGRSNQAPAQDVAPAGSWDAHGGQGAHRQRHHPLREGHRRPGGRRAAERRRGRHLLALNRQACSRH